MQARDVLLWLGSLLILAGIIQVFVQMILHRKRPISDAEFAKHFSTGPSQQADFNREGFKVRSAYPGMTMVCVGALLLIVAVLR